MILVMMMVMIIMKSINTYLETSNKTSYIKDDDIMITMII